MKKTQDLATRALPPGLSSCVMLPMDVVHNEVPDLTRDGSGNISMKEFAYGITFCVQLASTKSHTTAHYDRTMFSLIDDDGNGFLAQEELRSWMGAAEALGLIQAACVRDCGRCPVDGQCPG